MRIAGVTPELSNKIYLVDIWVDQVVPPTTGSSEMGGKGSSQSQPGAPAN